MSEEKTEHKNAPSRRSGTPGLADLAKELWDLHQSISILANNPFCYPDADGYSGEVLAKVARTKELTKALFSTHNDPLIKEALVVLSKLHKRVELIDNDLSFIASPPCPDNRYSTEEAAAFIEETDKETAATLKKLEKELPIFKEKHGAILEDIAARIEVFSNTKDDHQGNFLQKTKDEVFDLALEPDSRAYFRKQVEAFDYKVKEHQAEMEQIKKDYEANPKLKAEVKEVVERVFADGSNENPEVFYCVEGKGYLENFKNYIYYDNGDYWGPIAQTPDLVHYMTEFLGCPLPDDHKKLPNDNE